DPDLPRPRRVAHADRLPHDRGGSSRDGPRHPAGEAGGGAGHQSLHGAAGSEPQGEDRAPGVPPREIGTARLSGMLCLEMPARDYDAIVVGASFAGLAVARQLRGNVLLLDRNEVGTVQTSACGTPLWVPEALCVRDSVLEVHDWLEIRTPTRTVRYDLSSLPFCTFDYRAFCQGLLAQCRVRFLRPSVSGIQGGAVVTGEGRFTAPIIVDCSGWRRAVTGGAGPPPAPFGAGTHTPHPSKG